MSENRTLIRNEEETRKFIEKVLKPLKNDEVYMAVLNARKKYYPPISSSMEVVSRDIIRNNDTNKILRKLRRLSIVEGIYTDGNGNIIPVEAFSLYILPEPRSMLKAYNEFIKVVNEWSYNNLVRDEKDLELYRKLDLKLFSSIHKSKSKSNYFILDIDKKDEELLTKILNHMKQFNIDNESIRWISKTHGGYHIILDRNEFTGRFIEYVQKSYTYQLGKDVVELRKEMMTPTPGLLQGGFIVKEVQTC